MSLATTVPEVEAPREDAIHLGVSADELNPALPDGPESGIVAGGLNLNSHSPEELKKMSDRELSRAFDTCGRQVEELRERVLQNQQSLAMLEQGRLRPGTQISDHEMGQAQAALNDSELELMIRERELQDIADSTDNRNKGWQVTPLPG